MDHMNQLFVMFVMYSGMFVMYSGMFVMYSGMFVMYSGMFVMYIGSPFYRDSWLLLTT